MAMKIQDTKQKSDFFSSEIFDKTINVNLKGIFLCCKYFIKFHHNKNIDQRVINVGTIYSMHSPHHEIYNNESFFHRYLTLPGWRSRDDKMVGNEICRRKYKF